jgi:hypothetical protein
MRVEGRESDREGAKGTRRTKTSENAATLFALPLICEIGVIFVPPVFLSPSEDKCVGNKDYADFAD